jgi:hypothetical protein
MIPKYMETLERAIRGLGERGKKDKAAKPEVMDSGRLNSLTSLISRPVAADNPVPPYSPINKKDISKAKPSIAAPTGSEISEVSEISPEVFYAALERQCPKHVDLVRWQQAVEDGRRFLAEWGKSAAALGWTGEELFGLHTPPSNPHSSYNRMARYDFTGLVWLLAGNPVVAMTEATAAIQHKSGSVAPTKE